VVLAVLVWGLLVEWVATGNLGALLIELGLSGFRLRQDIIVVVREGT
jgi:hypothetical protein